MVYISDDGVCPPFPQIAVASEMTSIHFDVFSVVEVLKSLCSTCSVGPDGVPNVYLKNTCINIVYPLSLLFERSMIENYVPLIWKIAYIHKKGQVIMLLTTNLNRLCQIYIRP